MPHLHDLTEALARLLGKAPEQLAGVAGGDINEAFTFLVGNARYFVKLNRRAEAFAMFEAERRGLQLLHTAGAAVPGPMAVEALDQGAFFLMDFIPATPGTTASNAALGRMLATVHRTTHPLFGEEHDNFIGSLPQPNPRLATFSEFYRSARLEPQVRRAYRAGLLTASDLDKTERLYARLPDLIPPYPPTLIHGDLWGGNWLTGPGGAPFLIDPALSFAIPELDLAMSRLFGGFAPAFYAAYTEAFDLEKGHREREALFQLYYLLVHLNLFGSSYYAPVARRLNQYQ